MPWITNRKLESYLHTAYRLGYLAAAAEALEVLAEEANQPRKEATIPLDAGFVNGQRSNASNQ